MKHKNFRDYISALTDPFSQAILVVFTFVIIAGISYYSLITFRNFDPTPGLSMPAPTVKQLNVRTGLLINNFLKFDVVKNDFEIDAILWFEYDPKEVSLDELKQCSFSKGKLSDGSSTLVNCVPKLEKKGDLELARFNVKLNFVTNINYRMFPFDNHRMYLILNNRHLTEKHGAEVLFTIDPDNFIVSKDIYTPGWRKIFSSVRCGYAVDNLDPKNDISTRYPRAIFEIDFVNNSIKDILIIILPLFIVFFMALLSFYLMEHDTRNSEMRALVISSSAASALLSYRFVISSLAPAVDYFMFIDHIFNVFLICLFVIFLLNCFYLDGAPRRRGELVLGFHLVLIVSWAYFLYAWGA
ncbi:MAG TPA: hypothetical protein VJJ81_00465 [Candidatus Babeliales bacterium]|nr:hypothetical protein [Candidatus Babeliales bacterium]